MRSLRWRGASRAAIATFAVAVLFACALSTAQAAGKSPVRVSGSGTVVFVSVEGGFYGIVCDNGTTYDPQNLPDQYRVNGLHVRFNATVLADQTSFHMWGTLIALDDIQGVEPVKNDPTMAIVTILVPAIFIAALVGRVLWLRRKAKPPIK